MTELKSPVKLDPAMLELLGNVTVVFYREKTIEQGKKPTDPVTIIVDTLDPMVGNQFSYRIDPTEDGQATLAVYGNGELIQIESDPNDQPEKIMVFHEALNELIKAVSKTLMRSFVEHLATAQQADIQSERVREVMQSIVPVELPDVGVKIGKREEQCTSPDCAIHNPVMPKGKRGEHIH